MTCASNVCLWLTRRTCPGWIPTLSSWQVDNWGGVAGARQRQGFQTSPVVEDDGGGGSCRMGEVEGHRSTVSSRKQMWLVLLRVWMPSWWAQMLAPSLSISSQGEQGRYARLGSSIPSYPSWRSTLQVCMVRRRGILPLNIWPLCSELLHVQVVHIVRRACPLKGKIYFLLYLCYELLILICRF
jgi:hypothetical protein